MPPKTPKVLQGKRQSASKKPSNLDGLAASAVKQVERLAPMSEESLFQELAVRMVVARRDPKTIADFEPYIDLDQLPRPPKADLILLGRRIFQRANRELYQFVCEEDGADQELKKRLFDAILGKDISAGAFIGGVLVGYFGLLPGIATIIGAIFVKILVVPAGQEVCSFWKTLVVNASPTPHP
jgi:hypothetical protein